MECELQLDKEEKVFQPNMELVRENQALKEEIALLKAKVNILAKMAEDA